MHFSTKVSIIIPSRNEAAYISGCLDSILANDYPRELLEILVVDGMSDDGTRAVIQAYRDRFQFIKLVDNPKRIAPCAFNLGIREAAGDLIMIMGAHNTYVTDYISSCVRASDESGADNVGGIIRAVPRAPGLLSDALVLAVSHPFGVGNACFRYGTLEKRWVDTVFGGCYRREVFERIGLFNERLVFNQDLEFNRRLCAHGGRILLDPSILSEYHARSDLGSFCTHNFRNGSWVVLALLFSEGIPVSWRHLVPFAFVASLFCAGALSLLSPGFYWILLGISASYLATNLLVSAFVARREHDYKYFLLMPLAFACLHVSYGLGSLAAVIKTIFTPDLFRQSCRQLFRGGLLLGAAWGRSKPDHQRAP